MRRRGLAALVFLTVTFAIAATVLMSRRQTEPEVVIQDPPAAQQSPEELAAELGCGGIRELDYFTAPIRGSAATRGIACTIGPDEVHIFERASLGDLDESKSYATRQGGSLENIDRLVGVGAASPCLSLLVARDWFILANNEEILSQAETRIGGAERPIVDASPEASYIGPGGCGSG